MCSQYFESPIGRFQLCASSEGLTHILHNNQVVAGDDASANSQARFYLEQAAEELGEYFAQQRKAFTVPLAPQGTFFQQSVWNELLKIPYGRTVSYKDIADQLEAPKAVRAVGAANGKNPISIMIPCHRVIGKSGRLVGYAGGLDRKTQLLALEGAHALSSFELES